MMNDRTHDRDASLGGENHVEMAGDSNRRAYTPPTLTRHSKLSVITAGSISEQMWQFENSDPD